MENGTVANLNSSIKESITKLLKRTESKTIRTTIELWSWYKHDDIVLEMAKACKLLDLIKEIMSSQNLKKKMNIVIDVNTFVYLDEPEDSEKEETKQIKEKLLANARDIVKIIYRKSGFKQYTLYEGTGKSKFVYFSDTDTNFWCTPISFVIKDVEF